MVGSMVISEISQGFHDLTQMIEDQVTGTVEQISDSLELLECDAEMNEADDDVGDFSMDALFSDFISSNDCGENLKIYGEIIKLSSDFYNNGLTHGNYGSKSSVYPRGKTSGKTCGMTLPGATSNYRERMLFRKILIARWMFYYDFKQRYFF